MGARILRRGGRVRMGRRPRARESRGTRRIPGGCSEDGSRLRRPSSAGRGRTGTSAPRGGLGAGEKLRERWLDSTTKKTTSSRWRTRRGSGAHRHACHRLITLTSLYRWVERLGGTEKRAGKSAGELELVGPVGSSWLNPPGLVSLLFSRGGIRQGTRAFGSDAGPTNRVSRARSRREDDILTLSTTEPSASAGRYHPPLL